jgi:hypothetical protein
MTDLDSWGYLDDDGTPTRTDIPEQYRRFSRRSTSFPVSVDSALELDNLLLAELGAGASMRLDANGSMTPNRDSVDARIIAEFQTRSGLIPNLSPNEVGGYPVMENSTPYADQDHDGMADAWELAHGLDPDDPDDRNLTTLSSEGYTNLEIFLSGLADSTDPAPPSDPGDGDTDPDPSRKTLAPLYLLLQ